MGTLAVACEVCGGPTRWAFSQTTTRTRQRLDFRLCRECGLLFTCTPLSDDHLSGAYAGLDFADHYARVGTASMVKADEALDDLRRMALAPCPVVVDYGCGGGHFLRSVAEKEPSWSATGYDPDPGSVKLCSEAGLDATTHEDELPTADVVVMLDVAEHVRNPTALFARMSRLLKPGGILYLHTPRRCIWDTAALRLVSLPIVGRVGRAWLSTRVSILHLRLWTDAALDAAIAANGLQVIRHQRALELSWPISRYAEVYVGEKLGAPRPAVRAVTAAANVAVRCRLLRNKAVIAASRDGHHANDSIMT